MPVDAIGYNRFVALKMTPRLRKLLLTAHVTVSVGWLLIGWFVIVPASLASLLTGLVQSLGTEWGLFRHYWVSAKFLLTNEEIGHHARTLRDHRKSAACRL